MLKNETILRSLVFFQVSSLLLYLHANVASVGDSGSALPALLVYMIFSLAIFLSFWMRKRLVIRGHFFLFLILVLWLSFRVLNDTGDLERLKSVTVGTTRGIVLFYFCGAFLAVTLRFLIIESRRELLSEIICLCFIASLLWLAYEFSFRVRGDIFYLDGANGNYQRSGNFLSISFILMSFLYFNSVMKRTPKPAFWAVGGFWLVVYTISAVLCIIYAQLFGSNSATAVIAGVYLITIVISLAVGKQSIWHRFSENRLRLPWSKTIARRVTMIFWGVFSSFAILLGLIIVTAAIDLDKLRVFGFGLGSNTSLFSRYEILIHSGIDQISYAPVFGNFNVDYIVTGKEGFHLHSFFPYIFANMGVVGLVVTILLCLRVLVQLYQESKTGQRAGILEFYINSNAIYSIFIFVFILAFANLSVDITWSVFWLTLSLLSNPFSFK